MGFENVPRCQHIKINGTQCGSPALRRRRLCFFHRRALEQHQRILRDQFAQRPLYVPVLEDANAVQFALMEVMQALAYRRIEHKTAALMLYALQTASSNLRNTGFEACKTDVVIDRDTVHLTCLDGQQWFEEDFEDDEEDEGENDDDNSEENEEQDDDAAAETGEPEPEDEKVSAAVPPLLAKARAAIRAAIPLEQLKQIVESAKPPNRALAAKPSAPAHKRLGPG